VPFDHHYAIQFFICLLPIALKHCSVNGYADDHTLVTTIPNNTNRIAAATNLNVDLCSSFVGV